MLERYSRTRAFSDLLVAPLSAEDCTLQSMEDASPIRWHLAHTTWFFETFVLADLSNYSRISPAFEQLFNSYYNTVGEQFPRAQRGLLSRPSHAEVLDYRAHVDAHLTQALQAGNLSTEKLAVLEIGLHHEQQHQELMLTDIKHAFSINPLQPAYVTADAPIANENETAGALGGSHGSHGSSGRTAPPVPPSSDNAQVSSSAPTSGTRQWLDGPEGVGEIGNSHSGFAFDNERPRHRVYVQPFQIACRCVTNAEYIQFIQAGGYQQPQWWLSLGWNFVKQHNWTAPLYWRDTSHGWEQFTLAGRRPIVPDEPVCHVSLFEADAFARWAGCRLPTEAEWEICLESCLTIDPPGESAEFDGHWGDRLLSTGQCPHPQRNKGDLQVNGLENALGNVWEWTSSPYIGYPGFATLPGALGEYNGKFMCNQFVLRGGSCATPSAHLRLSYRNFFPPETRWQFSGIRLARTPPDD